MPVRVAVAGWAHLVFRKATHVLWKNRMYAAACRLVFCGLLGRAKGQHSFRGVS